MQVPYEVQVATLIIAGLGTLVGTAGFVLAILTYRLSVRNQVQPIRQEFYKRQAEGFAEILHDLQEVILFTIAHLATALYEKKTLGEVEATRNERNRRDFKLSSLATKYSAFLPNEFLKDLRAYKQRMADHAWKVEEVGKSDKTKEEKTQVLIEMLNEYGPYLQRLTDTARKAMGTDALIADTAGLFAVKDGTTQSQFLAMLTTLVRAIPKSTQSSVP